ncbi:MAG: fused MFS/spermidine synthase [Gemmatimonadaceae bacterium]
MMWLLYLVFVLSGAAGLIYESIWSRYLGLFVGHSAYAQIIVLAIFLGGMSLGALLVGQRSERLREPLLAYAVVEAATGLIGLVFHDVYVWFTGFAYDTLLPPLSGSPGLIAAKWAVAGLLILPQSILLGMTFPLMSAGALRRAAARSAGETTGRTLSLLYFANSLGAALGVLVAGFYLIRVSGLPGTLLAAAIINIVVALVTFVAVRSTPSVAPAQRETDAGRAPPPVGEFSPTPALAADPSDAPAITPVRHLVGAAAAATAGATPPTTIFGLRSDHLWRLLLAVSFGTAVASFVYEIAWIRMLSLVLGSATHSFELMLSAFILGLALGAFWVRKRADRFRDPIRALGIVQWCMGLLALGTIPIYLASFSWMAELMSSLDVTESGYRAFNVIRYAFCLAVMLPSTFCAGMTLPLITRTLIAAGRGERAVGAVYGVNTLGSIVGVVLAGLILLPWIGLKPLLLEGAIIDIALGLILLRATVPRAGRARWMVQGAAAVALLAVIAATLGNPFSPQLLASGVFRYGAIPDRNTQHVFYYEDGRTASVSAGRTYNNLYIATNGKPDASLDTVWLRKPGATGPLRPIGGDESTQALLPLIALAHSPQARSAAVIGQGSGMTSHFLLASPALREMVTIEIEPRMIEGSRRAFYPANRRVFDDRRARFILDDAKSYFAASRRRYDIIISEPSNPWVSGVSGLFTVEFYQRVRTYLSDGGVFGQWLHLYEIDDDLVLSVLAALHQTFRSYQIFQTSKGDILILASQRPSLPTPDWSVLALPGIVSDLRNVLPFSPQTMEATRLIDRAALAPLLDGWGQANSDFYPTLDLGAERTRYLRSTASGFGQIIEERFDMVAPFFGRRAGFATATDNPAPQLGRVKALATSAVLRTGAPMDSARRSFDPDLVLAMQRHWRLSATLTTGDAPPDWHLWMRDVVTTEHDLHGGTAGVADEEFYRAVRDFADRHAAPHGVRDAIAFLHGLATWDFAEASSAADGLLEPARDGTSWIADVDELRDGAVVAKLRTGDVAGARRYFAALAGQSQRRRTDLRVSLLQAYLRAAEHAASDSTAPGP